MSEELGTIESFSRSADGSIPETGVILRGDRDHHIKVALDQLTNLFPDADPAELEQRAIADVDALMAGIPAAPADPAVESGTLTVTGDPTAPGGAPVEPVEAPVAEDTPSEPLPESAPIEAAPEATA